MPQTRIHGKFYPLQHEEFLKLNKRLTQSELAVYLWLKTNDPFGDKLIEASTKQIADDLNVSRRTIQRALVKLRDENLIDLIITKFQYRVKSHPAENASEKKVKETLRVATPGSPSDTSVAIGTGMSPSVRECRHLRLKPNQSKSLKILILFRLIQTLKDLSQKASARIFSILFKRK